MQQIKREQNILLKNTSSTFLLHKNTDKAVILLHQFRTNPNMFNEICDKLYACGFSIFNLRIPGHGCSNDKDIDEVRLRDWEMWLKNFFLDVKDKYEHVYFIGASLGASLVLNLTIDYHKYIDKIIIISPFIKFKQSYAFITFLLRFIKKRIIRDGFSCAGDYDFFKTVYNFYSVPQLWQIYKLTIKLRSRQKKLNMPGKILCFLSKQDEILNFGWHKKFISTCNQIRLVELENSNHTSILDVEKDNITAAIMDHLGSIIK